MNDDIQYATMLQSMGRSCNVEFLRIDADTLGLNAAAGLNLALRDGDTDWVVAVHQDVVFPPHWLAKFLSVLAEMPTTTGLIGVFGTDSRGRFVGHIRDPHGHRRGGPLPIEAQILDEVLIAVRVSAGLHFDEGIPGFHLYGADLCLQARSRGLQVTVIDAPIIHRSGGRLDGTYWLARDAIFAKWGPSLGGSLSTPAALLFAKGSEALTPLGLMARAKRRRSRSTLICHCDAFAATHLGADE